MRRRLPIALLGSMAPVLWAGEGPVTIVRVRPSKILYLVGEPGRADVILKNNARIAHKGTLVVREEWGLSDSREVWSGAVALAAGQQKTVAVTWDLGQQVYGRALRAVFSVGGKPVALGAEFFQVATVKNWWRMNMLNGGGLSDLATRATDPFVTYGNFDNHFAYALSDFSHLAPEPDEYYSGQTRYHIFTKKRIETVRARHALGVRAGAYTLGNTGGAAGYELARQHPEWFLRDKRGAFHTCNRAVSPIELSYPPDQRPSAWYALAPDFGNPEVVQYGADEVVRAIRMFGWDAMFFDVAPYGMIHYGINNTHQPNVEMYTWDGRLWHRGRDPDAMSAKSARRTREIIRKSCPHAVLWYNGADPRSAGRYLQNRAALDDPYCGSLSELQGVQLLDPRGPWHYWRGLFESYVSYRNAFASEPKLADTVLNTGYLYNTGFHKIMSKEEFVASRDTWTVANHIGAVFLATRFHPCLLSTSAWRPSLQFMTRYSALLWAKDVKLVRKPWKTIAVESNREVWWEECVYARETDRWRDTLIHMLNSPEQETVDPKASRDPALAKFVDIEMQLAGDPAKAQVWALRPYDYDSPLREPVQVRLEPEVQGATLVIQVPPFHYHSLVVVREPQGGK